MPFWQRLLITVVAILVFSYALGFILDTLFGFTLPSYVSGVIGGVVAVPVLEFTRRIQPKE